MKVKGNRSGLFDALRSLCDTVEPTDRARPRTAVAAAHNIRDTGRRLAAGGLDRLLRCRLMQR